MTEALWSAEEAIAATGGTGPSAWRAHGVSIDSRSLLVGDLFVALAGPNFDGHDFVAEALSKGAAAAIVHRQPSELPGDLPDDAPLLVVEDSLEALCDLARASRRRTNARICGVTGSSGKTSTKEALKACLSPQGKTFASAGSLNNHWGVPLSLARLPKTADYAVFEMGMNHAGEIAELSDLVRPDVAVITTIGLAHIEFFDSQEGIADAKSEVFQGMSPQGTAVLPRDDRFYERLVGKAAAAGLTKILSFGRHEEADARLINADLYETCSAVQAELRGKPVDFCLAQPGAHWVTNALAVLSAITALGADPVTAAAELSRLQPVSGRGARRKLPLPDGQAALLIDESYNANPDSVKAALAVLGRAKPEGAGRRIAVLGDMLELGGQGPAYHAALAEAVTDANVDLAFLCGPQMAHLGRALPPSRVAALAVDSATLAPQVAEALLPGDVVLVKGSLGSRMRVVIAALDALAPDSQEASDTEASSDQPAAPRAANGG
ncbi:UDP-N-acetylmuramoylalanyl-D-glutamyl-2,6-diaminopimelate--D-alanyl-D-alanine ligase [Algihabitans sp.]|uniref:UDP-N-acetylmuramoylalanyl-D-glutamyl-2, 6-diaminopimelate--D-alanyl-D-alanine ligase n=1 Tax=Algihabitans sp. TaxID=2821514 RepID=UPI003BAD58D2